MSGPSKWVDAWNRYWFTPRSLIDLAVMRIVAVGLELFFLSTSWPVAGVAGEFARLHENTSIYHPISVLHLLTLPFGRDWMPPRFVLHAIFWISIATGIQSLIGFFTNRSLLVFSWSCLFIHSFRYSFGHVHNPDAIMMFALIALALSPCGGVLSVDAMRKDRRGFFDLEKKSQFAAWPILFIQWMFVLFYASAAFCKLRHGLAWANGYTLQWYLVQDALRWHLPAGMWLAGQHEIDLLLSRVTLFFESTFILVMFFPKLRWVYLPLGLGFHGAIFFFTAAPFFTFMALYSVFVPWTTVFEWIRAKVSPSGSPLRRQIAA